MKVIWNEKCTLVELCEGFALKMDYILIVFYSFCEKWIPFLIVVAKKCIPFVWFL